MGVGRFRSVLLAILATSVSASARDYRPAFHPERLKGPPAGRLNEVLVLGSSHLSTAPASLTPAMLAPLLDRLAAWKPTAIATEDLSGLQCDALWRYPARYAETIRRYCPDVTAAAGATGLDIPAANAEAERLLAHWPAAPTPADRRHLAAVFLAAGEPCSALVQWLRLSMEERRAGDGLDGELVTRLSTLAKRRNESALIGSTLAARLGLERVWSVDDHSADSGDEPDDATRKAYAEAITKAWDNPATRARQKEDRRLDAGLGKPGGALAMYRAFNAPEAPLRTYRADFGAALAERSAQQFGRGYVGYWETRNLRMVSNIRDVLALHPGTRLLAIVGASHKGYYEAYLDQMHDVHLTDPIKVLE